MATRDGDWFDVMQVCETGHKITARLIKNPENGRDFCPKCGAKTISACPSCNSTIPGFKHIRGVSYSDDTVPPDNCASCGAGFPWKKTVKAPSPLASIEDVFGLFDRFHAAVVQLRHRRESRPPLIIADEYDFQYLFGAMLQLRFRDVRPEEYTPSYAGGSSRIDYLLPDIGAAVELKKTRDTLKDKKLGEELVVDITRYKGHSGVGTLIALIYDPDHHIKNGEGLRKDLEALSTPDLGVRVWVRPAP